jgi:hypothetical protein
MKITEAMSEIKLFAKKIASQRDFVLRNLKREDRIRDPFEKDSTTQEAMVKAALQSISDNEKNIVAYRFAITKANIEAMHLLQYRQDAHLYARVEAPTIVASSAQTRMRILND